MPVRTKPKSEGVWRVQFCERCFGAFDVLDRGFRLPEICDECRRQHRQTARVSRYANVQERRRLNKAAWRERTGRH